MEGLINLLEKGGLAMYPLLFLSVLSWAVIVERLINMRSSNYRGRSFKDLKTLLVGGDIEGALKLLSTDSSHMAIVLKGLLQSYKEGRIKKEDMIKSLDFEISLLVPKLEKNLAILSTVASVAPLIGLFGTI
ncbi:MAG: MotA/TolQ/ExbB proton channel family protein, partial [Aquificaceae bacterium]